MRISKIIAAVVLIVGAMAHGQNIEPIKCELTVRVDQARGTIPRALYGHFAEHLGRCIYDGIWVGPESKIPNTNGVRTDIIEALKNLNIPVLRWPGGCFADEYHWRDGIGPREQRPRRLNTSWGGVIETNAFGTHEFMDLCEMLGADAYVGGNLGSGTPEEMMNWVEYMTSDSDSTLAQERKKNGREKPWKLPYFAVGNEAWGCGGNLTADEYAMEFKRFGTFVKNYSSNRIQKIACGAGDDDYKWTDIVMSKAARQMQGISLHHYTLPSGSWQGRKGSATDFDERQWHSTMVVALRMDELIRKHGEVMDKYDPQKRVGLIVDEWGTWYDPEPGNTMGALYQQNSIRDAIVAAINFDIFHEHFDRVKMANIAQTVNVLQAMILTDKEKMVLTPSYHVFEMYKVHQNATHVPVELNAPQYTMGQASVPSLHATASRDSAGRLHLSLVNLDPNRPAQVAAKINGAGGKSISGRILTAPAMNSCNTFDQPNAVRPVAFDGAKVAGDQIALTLPVKSVVVLEIQ